MIQPIRIRVSALIVRDGKLLVIRCHDEPFGLHYNVPGGGLHYGESLEDGLRRELREEACVDINVGRLVMMVEALHPDTALPNGVYHTLGIFFRCTIPDASEPRFPDNPDEFQTGVEWIPLQDLPKIPLLPQIATLIQSIVERDDPEPILYRSTSPY